MAVRRISDSCSETDVQIEAWLGRLEVLRSLVQPDSSMKGCSLCRCPPSSLCLSGLDGCLA